MESSLDHTETPSQKTKPSKTNNMKQNHRFSYFKEQNLVVSGNRYRAPEHSHFSPEKLLPISSPPQKPLIILGL